MKRNISTGSSGWAEHFDVASHLILSKPSEVGTVITLMLQIRKLSCTGVSHLPGSPSLAMAEPGSQPAPTQPPKTLTPPTSTTHCQELPIPPLFQTHPCLQGALQPPTTQGSCFFTLSSSVTALLSSQAASASLGSESDLIPPLLQGPPWPPPHEIQVQCAHHGPQGHLRPHLWSLSLPAAPGPLHLPFTRAWNAFCQMLPWLTS